MLIALIAISFSAFAKSDTTTIKNDFGNSFFVSAMGHDFPKTYSHHSKVPDILSGDFADVYGLCYERKVYKDWGIGASYAVWNTFPSQLKNVYGYEQEVDDGALNGRIGPGTIETIERYKMFDLFIRYRYNRIRKHKIEAGLGGSYTWGINTVIDTIYILPYDDYIIAHREPANYYGITAYVSYDYLCLHNRLAIGYEIKWHRYFGLYSPQIDYGFNVKFNF